MTAVVLPFPEHPRTCEDCVHYEEPHCLLFDEHIYSAISAAQHCNGYETASEEDSRGPSL